MCFVKAHEPESSMLDQAVQCIIFNLLAAADTDLSQDNAMDVLKPLVKPFTIFNLNGSSAIFAPAACRLT